MSSRVLKGSGSSSKKSSKAQGALGARKITPQMSDSSIYSQTPASASGGGNAGRSDGVVVAAASASAPASADVFYDAHENHDRDGHGMPAMSRFAYDSMMPNNAAHHGGQSAKGKATKRGDDIFGDLAVTAPQPQRNAGYNYASATHEDAEATAQKRFANAKSISSDAYHEREQNSDMPNMQRDARLERFTGAQSISSSDFYGDQGHSRGGGMFDAGVTGLVGRLALQATEDVQAMRSVASKAANSLKTFVQDTL